MFYSPEFKEYCLTFMGSDGSVVKRTQRYLHSELQQTPVSYCYLYIYIDTYVCVYICIYVCVCVYIYVYRHTKCLLGALACFMLLEIVADEPAFGW